MTVSRSSAMGLSYWLRFTGIVLIAFVAAFLDSIAGWAQKTFGTITIQMIIFHARMPLQGANTSLVSDAIDSALLPSLKFTLCFAAVLHLLASLTVFVVYRQKAGPAGLSRQFNRAHTVRLVPGLILSVALLFSSFQTVNREYQIVDYIRNRNTSSSFIEQHYADPAATALTFPEQKRNLIHIVLESMETSFMDRGSGGLLDENVIPELSALAENNISFSNTETLGGFLPVTDTQWTIAALFAQTAGLPLTLPIDGNAMSDYTYFFPGVTSLGDLLEDTGYQNMFLIGSDAVFGGRLQYFTQHGNYRLIDYRQAVELELIPKDYHVWWGFEDAKLFAIARDTLLETAASGTPFNLTLLTVDTHFEDGYVCELCEFNHNNQYANVLACASRQVAAFVEWIQQQDFYENTTIVITGDHLTMDADFLSGQNSDGRTIYNAFINAYPSGSADYASLKNRQFSSFDIFPTILSALGIRIEGDTLGLGVNLFSEKPTLLERYGLKAVNEALSQYSRFYTNRLFYGIR